MELKFENLSLLQKKKSQSEVERVLHVKKLKNIASQKVLLFHGPVRS